MTNTIQNANVYQRAFGAGLILIGFKNGQPEWLGNNKSWSKFDNGEF